MSAQPEYDAPDTGDPVALELDFADLARLTARLKADLTARLEQDDDAEVAALLLFDMREALDPLKDMTAGLETETAQRMGRRRTLDIPGFVVETKGGRDYKHWRNDDVAWAVLDRLAVDPATGEVDTVIAEKMGQARDALLNCAQISGWRVTQLRPLGIDPANYCEVTTGRRTVHVNRAVTE